MERKNKRASEFLSFLSQKRWRQKNEENIASKFDFHPSRKILSAPYLLFAGSLPVAGAEFCA